MGLELLCTANVDIMLDEGIVYVIICEHTYKFTLKEWIEHDITEK